MGTDLGNAPVWDDLRVSHADGRDGLPMAWAGDLRIPASGGTLSPVEAERCVAKISCNISKAPGIELESVRLCSIPTSVPLFAPDAAPSDNPDDYTDTPVRPLSGRQAAAEFYLLPNEQGTVTSITDQRQKNPDNAPANASCLLIRAAEGDRMLTYTVYLGENNTSDFNVRANRHYRMNVSVLGDNAVDTRIFSYALHVWDDFDQSGFGGYCTYEGTTCLHVDVSDNDAAIPLGGTITVTAGDASQVRLDDFRGGSGPDFEVPFPTSTNIFGVQYHPRVFTEKNARFAYHVTLRDPFGICAEYDFEHRMANEVHIMTGTGGDVAVEHALVTRSYGDGDSRQTAALCYEEGCRLTASANTGYTFVGWYADRGYTRLLSREAAYDFVPQENLETLFARFRARDIALDGAGTANCYIAMHLNSVYSFDATVMGNGRATKNAGKTFGRRSESPVGDGKRPRSRRPLRRLSGRQGLFRNWHGARQCRHRAVRRRGRLHLVMAYLVGDLRPVNLCEDLFDGSGIHGPQPRGRIDVDKRCPNQRTLLPVGAQRPVPLSCDEPEDGQRDACRDELPRRVCVQVLRPKYRSVASGGQLYDPMGHRASDGAADLRTRIRRKRSGIYLGLVLAAESEPLGQRHGRLELLGRERQDDLRPLSSRLEGSAARGMGQSQLQ